MIRPRFTVALAPFLGPLVWGGLHEPGRLPGLAVLFLAGLLGWPVLTVALLTGLLPAVLHGPRDWRRRYRARTGREGARSAYIRVWVRRACYTADRHRCVYCGQAADLACDHYLPWILGGLSTPWNLVTLCSDHNRAKSCYWEYRSGSVILGRSHPLLAPRILAAERRARRNPLRWWRAAWAIM